MNLINCIIVFFLTTFAIAAAPPIDVVFIIQNSDTAYHSKSSEKLKRNIIKQSIELQPKYRIKVQLLHEIFNYPGGWTIHNLIPQLVLWLQRNNNDDMKTSKFMDMKIINDNTRWIVFCEDKTKVRLKILMERLNEENHMKPLYLGHPLYDREPTIIHHFAFFENSKWFPYPMLRAGVVLSMPLFKSIADIYEKEKNKLFERQFSIDAGHELARFIYDNVPLTITTSTTTQYENRPVNIPLQTTSQATRHEGKAANPLTSTTTNNKEHELYATATNRGSSNLNNINSNGLANVCDVSHSEYRTTSPNEIKAKHECEILKASISDGVNTSITSKTSIIKKQKIILKKASYICPTATWESRSGSRSTSIVNNNNNSNGNNKSCAMYAEPTGYTAPSMSCTPVGRNAIYFAVKTCSKYHHERLPILQATWARYAKHIKYFSDVEDPTIPTTYTGVPNVEMGHCAKTLQILKMALEDIETHNDKQRHRCEANEMSCESLQIKWLFLSDDDTLLSVSGVCQVLGCYNSMDEIYLGERYGYRLFAPDGFNYITGGGGIAFSLPVVKLILQHCSCPAPTAPDDMILGSCLHSLQLKPMHSSHFHQARPNDYPLELLKLEPPVSFHKFWQLDPLDVYKRWFASEDHEMFADTSIESEELNNAGYYTKSRKLLTKTETLNLNKIPVPVMTSMHHSKERHVEL